MSETEHERRRFYRVKEAAAIMGIPLRTMHHPAEMGQIPCLWHGSSRYSRR